MNIAHFIPTSSIQSLNDASRDNFQSCPAAITPSELDTDGNPKKNTTIKIFVAIILFVSLFFVYIYASSGEPIEGRGPTQQADLQRLESVDNRRGEIPHDVAYAGDLKEKHGAGGDSSIVTPDNLDFEMENLRTEPTSPRDDDRASKQNVARAAAAPMKESGSNHTLPSSAKDTSMGSKTPTDADSSTGSSGWVGFQRRKFHGVFGVGRELQGRF